MAGNVHDYYRREFSYHARGRLASYADKRYFVSDSTQEACPGGQFICDPPPPWNYTWSTTTIRSVTFNPDNSGNRTDGSASLSNDRLSSMTDPYTAASYSFSYDAEGRRTAKTASGYAQTYGWNDLGQLTWVKTNSDSVAFGYDAAGRRVRKYRSSTGATAHYLWDGDNLLMELDGSGNRVRQYAYHAAIDRPVSVTISGTTYNYQLDEAGNVIAVWNASNAKVATYTDDPYGYPLATGGSVTQPLRWKGREYDSETGLYYIRARYYDPTVGRFLSEDPIGLEGGINPYTFADGEPVNRADPSGLDWFCTDDYTGGSKIGNKACTYQLDPMVITAHVWIGFKSRRGSPVGGSGSPIGTAGGGGAGLKEKLLDDMREMALNMPITGMTRVVPAIAGKITGFTKHGLNMAISKDGAGVGSAAMLDAVRNPLRVIQQSEGRLRYVGENATVVLNHLGEVITTWARTQAGLRFPP